MRRESAREETPGWTLLGLKMQGAYSREEGEEPPDLRFDLERKRKTRESIANEMEKANSREREKRDGPGSATRNIPLAA